MLTGIDHIVIVVRDLEATVKDYERLGFTVVPGGRHPIGTYNALISFADGAYIELIAFYEKKPKHRWWKPLQKGEGLVDFCLQTDDLQGDTTGFRKAGVNITDPHPLTRRRPDGYQLRWLLSIPLEGHRGVAPFLIQDKTEREERIPRDTMHNNGASGIGTVVVAVDDLPMVRHWYKSLLHKDGTPIEREQIQSTGIRFEIGTHSFEFVQPLTERSPLIGWLRHRGPSPYAATIRTNEKAPAPLDKNLTHGAALSFE
ncbi:MAG: VOC family protein [Candidatus Binatia bacterium]